MNVFEYAMKMEQDGEAYYRELAASADNKGLATILNFLADEEMQHYRIFQEMKDGKGSSLPSTTLMDNIANIFSTMKDEGEIFEFEKQQTEHYLKAQQIEKMSEDFYLKQAEETTSIHEAKLLKQIASEENRHFHILEGIIEFIQRPQQWLENAEWHHMEEY